VSVIGYKARNHPQQVAAHGARPDVDDRATPPEVFGPLHERFRFTVDAAASPANAKLPRFWTEADDGLAQSWAGERVWCNPPYSHPNLQQWVSKAWRDFGIPDAAPELVVMLVPANRTEQRWWQECVEPYRDLPGSGLRVEFLPGRIRFLLPGRTAIAPDERPPFGCCLLIWGENAASSSLRFVPDAVPQIPVPLQAPGQDALFDHLEAS
jgi:phage N-6-adenine-methyltransferase